MKQQESFVLVKPDGIQKGLVGKIIKLVEQHGLSITDYVRTKINRELAEKIYKGEEKEPYFEGVVTWISSDTILLLMVQGEDAINKLKWQIIGRYPQGLRGKFSENRIKNIAHVPDSITAAKREFLLVKPFFEEKKERDKEKFKDLMIFAITGMSESGKSTTGRYFESRGIPRLKIVKLFQSMCDKTGCNERLQEFTKKQEERDPYALWDDFIEELLREMNFRKVRNASIESLYGGGLGPYLKKRLCSHFCILYIDIPEEIRIQRQMQRQGLKSVKKAKEMLIPRDEIKIASGIPKLKEIAGEIIDNSGTLEELHQKIDQIISKYCKFE